MAGHYQLWLTDDKGNRILDRRGRSRLNAFSALIATRVANGIGSFLLSLPATFDESLLRPDYMVQVWRTPMGMQQGALWRTYLIREYEFETSDQGETLIVSGPDANDLLRRRIVASYAGLAESSKRDLADDLMKAVVSESVLDTGDPAPDEGTRAWSDLSVAPDLGDGPTIEKEFAWQKLLTPDGGGVLPGLAKAAREQGTEVFFDVVPASVSATGILFEFRTKTGQPGLDVTGKRVLFSQRQRNLLRPTLRVSYRDEENYIYTGGQGQGSGRNVQQVADADRYNLSQWNRCEGFADARNVSADDAVLAAGEAQLNEGRPRVRFTADLVDTRGVRFGRDWDFGYKVPCKYHNREFDAVLRAVTLRVEDRHETVSARVDSEDLVT